MKSPARLAGLMVFLVIACSAPSSTDTGYHLTEFSIIGPTAVSAGPSTLSVSNSGEFPHTLVISSETGTVVAATDLVDPGETVELGVDLSAGEYQFTCRIVAQTPDGEIVDHFEEGMSQTVVVED